MPAIDRYVREGHPYRLAFSVTSAIPEKRARLMPVERTHPLPELVRAIGDYARVRGERAMVAYVCIRGRQHRAGRMPRRCGRRSPGCRSRWT